MKKLRNNQGSILVGVILSLLVVAAVFLVLLTSIMGAATSNQGCDGGSIVEIALAEYESGVQDKTYNAGGQKYWSDMGFSSRVEWCGCFVGYCAKRAGLEPGVSMPDWAPWAANWAAWYDQHKDTGSVHANDGKYEPKPGDIAINGAIDASWSQHVGIVEKYENGYVYTIEGNSGDATARCIYQLGTVWTYFSSPNYTSGGGSCSGAVIEIPEWKVSEIGSTKGQRVRQGTYCIWEWDMRTHTFGEGAGQGRVQRAWQAAGSVTDSQGFNTLDGKYLIATTSIFGQIGDWVTFEFEDGRKIETIKVDGKAEEYCAWDPNPADTYGHYGGANVLEFCGDCQGLVDTKLGTTGVRVVRAYNHGPVA